jgi:hypothetical protein
MLTVELEPAKNAAVFANRSARIGVVSSATDQG